MYIFGVTFFILGNNEVYSLDNIIIMAHVYLRFSRYWRQIYKIQNFVHFKALTILIFVNNGTTNLYNVSYSNSDTARPVYHRAQMEMNLQNHLETGCQNIRWHRCSLIRLLSSCIQLHLTYTDR